MPFPTEAFKRDLLLDPALRYMNVGSSGPLPRIALGAQCDYLRSSSKEGPGSYEAFTRSVQIEADLRRALARYFGGHGDQYALTQNTSEGVNIALNGMEWQSGDEIITTDLEHGGLATPIYHLAKGRGLTVRIVRLLEGQGTLAALEKALSPRTRLLALSHIAYCDGRVLPLEPLIERAHAAGVPVLVDAAQSAGQITLDLEMLGADFVAIPGQKWLLGPEGTGALYLHGDWAQRLRPDRVGWASEISFDLNGEYSLKPSAAKFEVGTRDPAASLGLTLSLDFLRSYGQEAIAWRIRELSAYARKALSSLPSIEWVGPTAAGQTSGLLAFRVGTLAPAGIAQYLAQSARIITRSIPPPHPPAVRISLHAYITEADLDALAEVLLGIEHGMMRTDPAPPPE